MVMAMKAYVVKELIVQDLGYCYHVVFRDAEGKLQDKVYLKFYKEVKKVQNVVMLVGQDNLVHRVFVVEDPTKIRIV